MLRQLPESSLAYCLIATQSRHNVFKSMTNGSMLKETTFVRLAGVKTYSSTEVYDPRTFRVAFRRFLWPASDADTRKLYKLREHSTLLALRQSSGFGIAKPIGLIQVEGRIYFLLIFFSKCTRFVISLNKPTRDEHS